MCMSCAGFTARNIVEVIDPFDFKWDVAIPLQKGEVPPMILDLGEYDQITSINSHRYHFHIQQSMNEQGLLDTRGGNDASMGRRFDQTHHGE